MLCFITSSVITLKEPALKLCHTAQRLRESKHIATIIFWLCVFEKEKPFTFYNVTNFH